MQWSIELRGCSWKKAYGDVAHIRTRRNFLWGRRKLIQFTEPPINDIKMLTTLLMAPNSFVVER